MSGFVTNPYKHITPIKQSHRNSCWAACLAWWCKAVNNNTGITQRELRNDDELEAMYKNYGGVTLRRKDENYGTLEDDEMLWLLQQARWGMSVQQFTSLTVNDIKQKLAKGPVYIGYFDAYANGNHVNVICGFDDQTSMCEVMEPRTGRFVEKGIMDLTFNSAMILLGWKP